MDKLIGFFIYNRPYVWIERPSFRDSHRKYLVDQKELVYTPKGRKISEKVKGMKSIVDIWTKDCNWAKNYFEIFDPTIDKIVNLHINGQPIDVPKILQGKVTQEDINFFINATKLNNIIPFIAKPNWYKDFDREVMLDYPEKPTSSVATYNTDRYEVVYNDQEDILIFLAQCGKIIQAGYRLWTPDMKILTKRSKRSNKLIALATLSPQLVEIEYKGQRLRVHSATYYCSQEDSVLELPSMVQYLLHESQGRLHLITDNVTDIKEAMPSSMIFIDQTKDYLYWLSREVSKKG